MKFVIKDSRAFFVSGSDFLRADVLLFTCLQHFSSYVFLLQLDYSVRPCLSAMRTSCFHFTAVLEAANCATFVSSFWLLVPWSCEVMAIASRVFVRLIVFHLLEGHENLWLMSLSAQFLEALSNSTCKSFHVVVVVQLLL